MKELDRLNKKLNTQYEVKLTGHQLALLHNLIGRLCLGPGNVFKSIFSTDITGDTISEMCSVLKDVQSRIETQHKEIVDDRDAARAVIEQEIKRLQAQLQQLRPYQQVQ